MAGIAPCTAVCRVELCCVETDRTHPELHICNLLSCYATSSDNSLPMFRREKPIGPIFKDVGPWRWDETLVRNYRYVTTVKRADLIHFAAEASKLSTEDVPTEPKSVLWHWRNHANRLLVQIAKHVQFYAWTLKAGDFSIFWGVTHHRLVFIYRRCGTTYRPQSSKVKQPAWPSKIGTIGCAATSVTVYHPKLRNTPEEWTSYINGGGSLKSWKHEDRLCWREQSLYEETLRCTYEHTSSCHVGYFNITVVWNLTPYHLVDWYQVFGGIRYLPHLPWNSRQQLPPKRRYQLSKYQPLKFHKATQSWRFFITSNRILVRSLLGMTLRNEGSN